MSWTISREYHFCAAHRLEGHPKCGRMHGHNYLVEVMITAHDLYPEGWILDYGQLDAIVKPLIDELDHRYLVSRENVRVECPYALIADSRGESFHLPIERSTAELMSEWLHNEIRSALELFGIIAASVSIRVKETPKSDAIYNGR